MEEESSESKSLSTEVVESWHTEGSVLTRGPGYVPGASDSLEDMGTDELVDRRLNLERELIDMTEESQMRSIKGDYAEAARSLARRHRCEAEALETRWREMYCRAVNDGIVRVETANISARLLDESGSFEVAETVRESAQASYRIRANECYRGFAEQYRLMIERHAKEFDRLHMSAKESVSILKGESERAEIAAELRAELSTRTLL
jgi:hypothetical protein